MSKKKKSQKPKKNPAEVKTTLDASLEQNNELETAEVETPVEEQEEVVTEQNKNKTEQNKDKNDKNDKKKNNKKKPKEKGKLKRMAKESLSEIKNVVWPSFGDVVKKTGVVLVVVLVFAVVIFGIDFGLGELVKLLKK